MKEATGELNMTLVTIIAIAAVLAFVVMFLPQILDSVGDKWEDTAGGNVPVHNRTVNKGGSGGSGGSEGAGLADPGN